MEPENDAPKRQQTQIKRLKLLVIGLATLVLALTAAGAGVLIHKHRSQPQLTDGFPNTVISRLQGFKLYYLKPGFSTDFALQPQTVSYNGGLLVFSMRDPLGKTLAFTEEATPPGYDISGLEADKQFNNEFGQAFITDATDRTTGTLFTQDGSWILINAPQPIGADLMQQILDALVPVSLHRT